MICIRCREKPAEESCPCLILESRSDTAWTAGGQAVRTTEYAAGFEEAGLCQSCRKKIAFREPKALFPKAYRTFYLIWGVLSAVWIVSLIIAASAPKVKGVFGPIAIITALAALASLIVFETAVRILGSAKRLKRSRLLIACAVKYPYKGHYSNRNYIPFGSDFYTDYASFRRVNSEILEDNAKKIYERLIKPGAAVTFGDELKSLF